MLWTALEDPDPVLIFEHGTLYNINGDAAPGRRARWTSTRAAVRRAGRRRHAGHATAARCQGARRRRACSPGRASAAEVIDLRTLRPLDDATIVASVRRTHRAVVVDEGWRSGSLSAEISARITEQAFYDLDAPGGAGVHRRGADALRRSTSRRPRCRRSTTVVGRRPEGGGVSGPTSRCRRWARTWTRARCWSGWSSPGDVVHEGDPSRSSTPPRRRSRWRPSTTASCRRCWSSPAPGSRWARRWPGSVPRRLPRRLAAAPAAPAGPGLRSRAEAPAPVAAAAGPAPAVQPATEPVTTPRRRAARPPARPGPIRLPRAAPRGRARRRPDRVDGTGAGGRVTRADVDRAAAARHRPPRGRPTGLAVRPAAGRELGVDLDRWSAPATRAGPRRRRQRRADRQRDASAGGRRRPTRARPAAPTPPAPARAAGSRDAIAALMARSKREIPHYYLATTVDLARATGLAAPDATATCPSPSGWSRPRPLLRGDRARRARGARRSTASGSTARFLPGEDVHLGVAVSLRGGGWSPRRSTTPPSSTLPRADGRGCATWSRGPAPAGCAAPRWPTRR